MKKLSKKTISTLLAGTTVAAAGVLLGVGLTQWTDSSDDYIKIHYGEEEVVLNETEINQLEEFAWELTETDYVNILEDTPP